MEGFKNAAEFMEFMKKTNAGILSDFQSYLEKRNDLRLRDPENPEKFIKEILIECADGRNSLTLFLPSDRQLRRFDMEWLPFAGDIVFPEMTLNGEVSEVTAKLAQDEALKKKFFERLDFLFGFAVERAIREFEEGTLSKVYFEFQSHFDSHNDHHGCGAHKSNLLAAQLEAIKDCLVTEEWLKNHYPIEYGKNLFHVFRTTHDTGENGHVYSAAFIDNKYLTEEVRKPYASLFEYSSKRYEAPRLADPENSIVKKYQGNPMGIILDEHDEQTIRVSDMHFATTIYGQSVLEVSWTDDPQTIYGHLNILLGIIEKNYRTKHPDHPAIIHFDLVEGNDKMKETYNQVRSLLDGNEELQKKLAAGSLLIVVTVTDRNTFQTAEIV